MMLFFFPFSFLFLARSFPFFISPIHYGRKEAPTPPASKLMYRWEGGFRHMLLLLFGEQQQLQMCVGRQWRVMPWMMSNCIWHLHSFRSIANAKATNLLWTQAWMPPCCRVKLWTTSGIHFWMKQSKNLYLIFLTIITSYSHSQISMLFLFGLFTSITAPFYFNFWEVAIIHRSLYSYCSSFHTFVPNN